jgi:uncharacterized protein
MSLRTLVEIVLRDYALRPLGTHGLTHWLRVRANGLALAAATPDADAEIVELFSLFHDSRRLDEMGDPEHGARAAEYVWKLGGRGLIEVEPARLDVLARACEGHQKIRSSTDLTIGCCWDADRLDLSRLDWRPDPHYLSTAAALDRKLQAAAWRRGRNRVVDRRGTRAWGVEAVAIDSRTSPASPSPAPE